jgi:hypothetical protein
VYKRQQHTHTHTHTLMARWTFFLVYEGNN